MNCNDSLRLVPNGLSFARIGLGLAYPLFPDGLRPWVIAAAAVTDALDGLVARWLHCASDTGRLLDPIADKVFVLMLAGTLLAEEAIPVGWAVGIAARDLVVLAGAATVALCFGTTAARQLRPTWLGKCTTAAQFAVLLVAAVWGGAPVWLLVMATTLSVLAGAHYVLVFVRNWSRPVTETGAANGARGVEPPSR